MAMDSKDVAYAALKDSGNRATIDLVRDLLTAFRAEGRAANDNGTYEEVLRRQGANQLCTDFLDTWLNFEVPK